MNPEAPAISEDALAALADAFYRAQRAIDRLAIQYPKFILSQLKTMPVIDVAQLESQSAVTDWATQLQQLLEKNNTEPNVHYAISVKQNPNNQVFYPAIIETKHGIQTSIDLIDDLFRCHDYNAITRYYKTTHGLLEKGAYIKRGETKNPITTFDAAYHWLLEQGKKGLAISRYKGLGEMNPEQLWETTMDPESRRLLKVTIEDVILADEMFTTLMGDAVEPRRKFIEDNALSATNIDV